MVDRLRQRAGLPMPVVAVAPHEQPNAFATGRNPEHAVVAVTTGILKYMPQDELEGVIAHELAHIKNRDMLISTIAAGIAGAISNLPYLLMFGGGRATTRAGIRSPSSRCCCWRPIGAMLIQFAVSRQREFEADRVGAEILGRPDAAGQRAPAARRDGAPDPDAGGAGGRAAGAGQPARRLAAAIGQAVQHPPADRGAGRAARGDGGGPVVVGLGHHSAAVWLGFTGPRRGAPGPRPGSAQPARPTSCRSRRR